MQISSHLYLVGSDQLGITTPMDPNVYLIDGGDEKALIDLGRASSIDILRANMREHGFDMDRSVTAILTHSDAGHSEMCAAAKGKYGVKVWAPAGAEELLATGTNPRVRTLYEYEVYGKDYRFPTVEIDRIIHHGDTLSIGNIEVQAIQVRGHSDDSLCLLATVDGARVIFTGDTIFYGGVIGLVNLPGSSIEDYRSDINRLGELRVDSLFPAHGMFVLRNGQKHLDAAITAFRSEHLPPNQLL